MWTKSIASVTDGATQCTTPPRAVTMEAIAAKRLARSNFRSTPVAQVYHHMIVLTQDSGWRRIDQWMHQRIAQRPNLLNERKNPQTYPRMRPWGRRKGIVRIQLACPRNFPNNFPLDGRSNLTAKVYWPRYVPWTIYNALMEAMCREILATTAPLIAAQMEILRSWPQWSRSHKSNRQMRMVRWHHP